jgi:ankyrin repeat protein
MMGNHEFDEKDGDTNKLTLIAFSAVRHNKFESVESIIRDNPSLLDAIDEQHKNNTLLHVACSDGYARLARLLIKAGANIDAANSDGNTPLHLCYLYGRHALVSMLLASKANENAQNKKGQVPSQLLSQ